MSLRPQHAESGAQEDKDFDLLAFQPEHGCPRPREGAHTKAGGQPVKYSLSSLRGFQEGEGERGVF